MKDPLAPGTNPIKKLQVLHSAMLGGMVLFCVVAAVVYIPVRVSTTINMNKILQVVILAIGFVCIKLALDLFRRKLQAIPPEATPQQKINLYRPAAILKWALMEIPVLLSAAFFMITRNYAFIVLAFALIILFAMHGPLKVKLMIQLGLSQAEADELDGTR